MKNPRMKKASGEFLHTELRTVRIPCGICQECRRKRASEWRARMVAENKTSGEGVFVTLTISDEYIAKIADTDIDEASAIMMRRFTKNLAKTQKKIKRLFVPEVGGEDSERLHFHGMIWLQNQDDWEAIEKAWPYGIVDKGYSGDDKAIAYISKYIYKGCEKFPNYKPRVFASKGIGYDYLKSPEITNYTYQGESTETKMKCPTGGYIELPDYWKRKIYTQGEIDQMTLYRKRKRTQWVDGIEFDVSNTKGEKAYIKALMYQRKVAKEAGFPEYKEKMIIEKPKCINNNDYKNLLISKKKQ